ncbi:hypothetical protein TcWFU_007577 [Taenia crassiceps]|uniref:Transmembrane protein 186 n=1 Tax=Taenia crassiceps TaxID=6207 RepID=A0ABR4Q7F2_9CEST
MPCIPSGYFEAPRGVHGRAVPSKSLSTKLVSKHGELTYKSKQRLPDAASKIGSDASPRDLRENQANALNVSRNMQMISRSIEDPALSANLGSGDVKETMNRNSSQKISLSSAYPGRGSSSNALPCSSPDAPTPATNAALSSTQFPKCGVAELHPSDHNHEQPDSSRSGRFMVHPYNRPKTLTIRAYSANDTSPKPSSRFFDYSSPIAEGPGSEISKLSSPMARTSANSQAGNTIGTLRYLRPIPGGTCALRSRCVSGSTSKTQPLRRPLSKFTTSASLDSATTTTMSCTLLHHPSPAKAFPFLPDGTAYLLSDEQHRAVEQSLCSTKLLLHRLKRLLVENTGHLHSFAEQVGNFALIPSQCNYCPSEVYGNRTPTLLGFDTFEVESPSSKNSFNLFFSFPAVKEPTNLDDAILEIRWLKEENSRLQEELAKRERYIHLFLQKQSGDNNLTLMVSATIGKQISSNGSLYSMLPMRCLRALHISLHPRYPVSRLKPLCKPPQNEKTIMPSNIVETRIRGVDMAQSEIDFLTKRQGHPDEWQLIYRLRAMPIAQALSRLKLLLTFSLVTGASVSAVGHHFDLVDVKLCQFLFFASLFSLCTLCVFSFYSTKIIGVVSQNKSTGLLRLGLLNFWGMRRNIIIHPEQLIPATDLCDTKKRIVRVGLTGDTSIPKSTSGEFGGTRESRQAGLWAMLVIMFSSACACAASDETLMVKKSEATKPVGWSRELMTIGEIMTAEERGQVPRVRLVMSQRQLKWLNETIQEALHCNENIIVACHAPLHPLLVHDRSTLVANWREILKTFMHCGVVRCCLMGRPLSMNYKNNECVPTYHQDHGILYYTLPSVMDTADRNRQVSAHLLIDLGRDFVRIRGEQIGLLQEHQQYGVVHSFRPRTKVSYKDRDYSFNGAINRHKL